MFFLRTADALHCAARRASDRERRIGGAARHSGTARAPEKNAVGVLTVEKTVIRFRPKQTLPAEASESDQIENAKQN